MKTVIGIIGWFFIVHALRLGIESSKLPEDKLELQIFYIFVSFLLGIAILIYNQKNELPTP